MPHEKLTISENISRETIPREVCGFQQGLGGPAGKTSFIRLDGKTAQDIGAQRIDYMRMTTDSKTLAKVEGATALFFELLCGAALVEAHEHP